MKTPYVVQSRCLGKWWTDDSSHETSSDAIFRVEENFIQDHLEEDHSKRYRVVLIISEETE